MNDWMASLHQEAQDHCRCCMPANPAGIINILGIPAILVHEVRWIILLSSEASSARSARYGIQRDQLGCINQQLLNLFNFTSIESLFFCRFPHQEHEVHARPVERTNLHRSTPRLYFGGTNRVVHPHSAQQTGEELWTGTTFILVN